MKAGLVNLLVGAAVVLLLAVAYASRGEAGTVSCDKVMAKANQLARSGSPKSGDVVYIARKLDTDSRWVERCFQAYGRRVTRHAVRGSEEPEDVLEGLEEAEREEPAREEDQGYVKPQPTLGRQKAFPKWEDSEGKWPKRDGGKDHPEEIPWPRRDKQ